jgi:2-amino-4-hydroxy-6-hydroxymethyldihydropteridine diphosphokinase
MNKVLLLLGSNISDPEQNLILASDLLANKGFEIILKSTVFRTEPWGKSDQPWYYNQALSFRTSKEPEQVLKICLDIEKEMGRIRSEKYGPRIIDIDILLFDNNIINSELLKIPHPNYKDRRFALTPACEIEPDWIHPVLQKTNIELLKNCIDPLQVEQVKF